MKLEKYTGTSVSTRACVPGFGRFYKSQPRTGSGVVWRVSLWVGLVLRLVCEVLVSVSSVCPGSPPSVFEPVKVFVALCLPSKLACLFGGVRSVRVCARARARCVEQQ